MNGKILWLNSCPHCEKWITDEEDFQKQKLHSDTRRRMPFTCPLCKEEFSLYVDENKNFWNVNPIAY